MGFLLTVHVPVPPWGAQAAPPQDGGSPACVTPGQTQSGAHQWSWLAPPADLESEERGLIAKTGKAGFAAGIARSRLATVECQTWLAWAFCLERLRGKTGIALKERRAHEWQDSTAHASISKGSLGWGGDSFIQSLNKHTLRVCSDQTLGGVTVKHTHVCVKIYKKKKRDVISVLRV